MAWGELSRCLVHTARTPLTVHDTLLRSAGKMDRAEVGLLVMQPSKLCRCQFFLCYCVLWYLGTTNNVHFEPNRG